jgi:hypothetical protein
MPRKKKNGYRSMLDAFPTHALRLIRIGTAVSLHGAPSSIEP